MAESLSGSILLTVLIKPEDTTVAGNDTVVGYWRAPCTCTLIGAYVTDTTAVTNDTTDYLTVTVQNTGTAGSGSTSMASANSNVASGNFCDAGVPLALTLSTTSTNLYLTAGEIVKILKTEAGSGKDFTSAVFQLVLAAGR